MVHPHWVVEKERDSQTAEEEDEAEGPFSSSWELESPNHVDGETEDGEV